MSPIHDWRCSSGINFILCLRDVWEPWSRIVHVHVVNKHLLATPQPVTFSSYASCLRIPLQLFCVRYNVLVVAEVTRPCEDYR
jgi:hypothetical protein